MRAHPGDTLHTHRSLMPNLANVHSRLFSSSATENTDPSHLDFEAAWSEFKNGLTVDAQQDKKMLRR